MYFCSQRAASDYKQEYNRLLKGRKASQFNTYAYDGIWLIALALQQTITTSNNRIDWARVKSEKFIEEVAKTQFFGASVSIKIETA